MAIKSKNPTFNLKVCKIKSNSTSKAISSGENCPCLYQERFGHIPSRCGILTKSKSYLEPELINGLCNLYFRWDKPVLLAWGLSDKYLPQSVAEEFQKGNPDHIKLKLIEGAGHMPQEDW